MKRSRSRTVPIKKKTSINTSKIGVIQITLNLVGDINDKGIKFVPSMINPNIKVDTIYFPMTIELSNSKIHKAVPEISDPLLIFVKYSYYSKFMFYATDPYRYTPIELGTDTAETIINKNIKYIVNAFFSKYIQINGRSYRILSKEVNNNKTSYPKSKGQPLITKINVELNLIERKDDTIVNRTRQGCIAKRQAINKTTMELFNRPLFSIRQSDIVHSISDKPPIMYSNVKRGTTMGRTPSKTINIQNAYYPPYGSIYPQPFVARPPGNTSQYTQYAYAPYGYAPTMPITYPIQQTKQSNLSKKGGTRRKNNCKSVYSRTRRTSRRNPFTSSAGIKLKSTNC